MQQQDTNLAMLRLAVEGLGPLADEVVMLGGCAVELLITDPAAPATRETDDVDMLVEVASQHDYYDFARKLREQGLREDQGEEAPLCRWIYREVKIDVMPTDSAILGFGNRWYAEAMQTAELVTIPGGSVIRMVSAPYFLVTKLEAFYGRGCGDYMASHDLEDLIAVLNGRESIVDEAKGNPRLCQYLAEEFSKLLEQNNFMDALPWHLPPDAASQQRKEIVLQRMQAIVIKE